MYLCFVYPNAAAVLDKRPEAIKVFPNVIKAFVGAEKYFNKGNKKTVYIGYSMDGTPDHLSWTGEQASLEENSIFMAHIKLKRVDSVPLIIAQEKTILRKFLPIVDELKNLPELYYAGPAPCPWEAYTDYAEKNSREEPYLRQICLWLKIDLLRSQKNTKINSW